MVYQSRLFLVAGFLAVFSISPALAQRGPRSAGGDRPTRTAGDSGSARARLPAVGTALPVVKAFDDQGIEFSTASLRGSYTVLVFGCLT